jgi:hypothetical protein
MTKSGRPSPARMEELAAQHDRLERENDVDALMATIADHPNWEQHPLGMRIEGRDAVRAYYPSTIHGIIPRIESSKQRFTAYADGVLVRESLYRVRQPDGQLADGQAIIIFEFDEDERCLSERAYGTGAMAALMAEAFKDVWAIPGVSRIGADG